MLTPHSQNTSATALNAFLIVNLGRASRFFVGARTLVSLASAASRRLAVVFAPQLRSPETGRVLNTCLYQGFRADLADRAEGEIR